MILHNVLIKDTGSNCDIHVDNGFVTAVTAPSATNNSIVFENAIAFPGLINSHDHLDFNSFPLLGNKIYDSYVAWGNDIHAENSNTINQVLQIPKALRVQWSLYKNLLNGVGTVVQHGEHFNVRNDLVDVYQNCTHIHSIRQEKKWKLKLNKPRTNNWPVVVHIGEGTNTDAAAEIDELLRWNLLRKKLIGIHGVAMSPGQAKHFRALIWCPESNYFLLGKTADIRQLKQVVPILFGTDSTLTGHWSIWEQLRTGLETGMVTREELYNMITEAAAQIWQLPHNASIRAGAQAKIVVARAKTTGHFMDSFFALTPKDILLVIHDGEVRLFDETLYKQLQSSGAFQPEQFSKIFVSGQPKYVYGNLPALMDNIQQFAPGIVFPDISIT